MAYTRKLTAFIFLLLLAGHEGARIEANSTFAQKSLKTPDPDLPVCGKDWFSCKADGCHREYVWLDTPRQTCRFTEKYKLQNDQEQFLKVELVRLEEKTEKFASKGCIFGGWWMKCQRRMKQMIRLLQYVTRALEDARADPNHPARGFAMAESTKVSLTKISNNFVTGFDKNKIFKQYDLKFGIAHDKLMHIPTGEGQNGTDAELEHEKEAAVTAAMLEMVGTKLTPQQQAELVAMVDSEDNNDKTDVDNAIDAISIDIDDTSLELASHSNKRGLSKDQAEELDRAIKTSGIATSNDTDDELMRELAQHEQSDEKSFIERTPASFTEFVSRGGTEDGKDSMAAAMRGTGPLKWIFKHGLGWLVTRIAWLILFLLGTAVGIIRSVVLFPLLLVGCVLFKFIKWVFKDLVYEGLWEGNGKKVVKGFKSIGKCAPKMWSWVGFDPALEGADVSGQVFVQPARFASDVTGVKHAWKTAKALCNDVTCGPHSQCDAGKCFCKNGYYPSPSGGCGQLLTASGCACRVTWESNKFFYSKTRFGCPASTRKCAVDTQNPTYENCRGALAQNGLIRGVLEEVGVLSKKPPKDRCKPLPFRAEVPRVN